MIYIALLRGINVGGKNRLLMKDLKTIFETAGCANVQTYIQSGNVVFESSPEVTSNLSEQIAQAIREQNGLEIPVVMRSAPELQEIAEENPFLPKNDDNPDPKTLHVAFLMDVPSDELVATLEPDRSPPDQFIVRGREIYCYCPNGLARTKLSNQYFDSRLKTTSTARNWKTVLKLLEMAGRR